MHLLVILGRTPVLPDDIFDATPERQTSMSACLLLVDTSTVLERHSAQIELEPETVCG